MVAQLLRLDDYRPHPTGAASLWLNAMFHFSLGMILLALVPLVMITRRIK